MPKHGRKADRTGRSKGIPRHIRIDLWVLQGAAYKSLKPVARSILVELHALYNGGNNGQLFLSVREAGKRLNVAPNTAVRGFAELVERGFIRAALKGRFTLKQRHATRWVLTEYEYDGQLPSKDFARWSQKIQKPVSAIDTDGIKLCYTDARTSRRMSQNDMICIIH